jgi:type IV pilus assembly protein PilY1
MLGVAATDRSDLINWVRGTDNAGDELGPTTTPTTTVRPSIHGDVLHSRPAVVNYGGSTGVVVFYGANDGMLHAVNGNQSGTGAGQELWSFIPQEAFGKLSRLRSNFPKIRRPDRRLPAFSQRRERREIDHLCRHASRRPAALRLRCHEPQRPRVSVEQVEQ